jgi:AGZA family xanthine/uracil permease-like MFS transporter
MESIRNSIHGLDAKLSRSTFGRVFRLDGSGHASSDLPVSAVLFADITQEKERKGAKFMTEIRAGLTTFFTMAYIIAVNVGTEVPEYI